MTTFKRIAILASVGVVAVGVVANQPLITAVGLFIVLFVILDRWW